MKKNGFTLVELIITIALLGFVGVVIGFNMFKVIDNQKQAKYEKFKTLVEEAACTYVGLSTVSACDYECVPGSCSGECVIEGEELVLNGMIDEEINGFFPKDYKVDVTISYGLKNCVASKIDE